VPPFANLQTDSLKTIPQQCDHTDLVQLSALERLALLVVFAEVGFLPVVQRDFEPFLEHQYSPNG
jgi:hypothetical protein